MPEISNEQLEETIKKVIQKEFDNFVRVDRYTFQKLIQIIDGRNIQLGLTTGTKIGTATTQKLGFYNATPVDQPATVNDPSGKNDDLDSEARAAISTVIDRLQELGLIA